MERFTMKDVQGHHAGGGPKNSVQQQPPQTQHSSVQSPAFTPQGGEDSTFRPQYQEYPGATGGGEASPGNGLTPNIATMLSYLLFGWVGGLIMYFTQKDREVRFHAAQSILTFGGLTIISWAVGFLDIYAGFFFLLGVSWLISLLSLVLLIFMSIQGYQLKHTKLPIVGTIAEQWAAM
jgi:uncharacterized membrane protein